MVFFWEGLVARSCFLFGGFFFYEGLASARFPGFGDYRFAA